jgi:drug/metabolite transporter (DMT)-like permease
MSRSLVQLDLWLLGPLLVIGVPLVTVAVQAAVRRLAPGIVEGEHNDVAGFLIAVVGVVYAVLLAFIVIVTWEEFRDARATVDAEAGALRSLYRDSQSLPEPAKSRMSELVIRYGREVADEEWAAMDDGTSSRAAFDLVSEMFGTLGSVATTTPTQETFLADALVRLNDVADDRAERITVAEEGQLSIMWVAIILGGILTVGFALLFGVSNERLHYVMVGGFAAVLALQILVILVLSHPFSGDVRVTPRPFEDVVRDFGG